jgi:hypothetical protein
VEKQYQAQSLYYRMIAVSGEAFEARLFDVSYHALAGALHCARQMENDQLLRDVAARARAQLAWIDEHEAGYEHSTESAAIRHHDSIFSTLARQADALLEIRKAGRLFSTRGNQARKS